jgi:hypothetical protein
MNPSERWDGPIQDAIREHDRGQGHWPKAPTEGRPVMPVDWFRRMPNGGTVFLQPVESLQLRVLDAYCRKGGSSAGYKKAGFHVTGVDKEDHSDGYAGDVFIQGDANEFILEHGHDFDLIHAGPPCQADCALMAGTNADMDHGHVSLLAWTRDCLNRVGRPYVIEQPIGKAVMRQDVLLCGLSFDLKVFRHRQFELGGWTAPQPPHLSHRGLLTIGWRHGCKRTVEPSVCPLHQRWCKGSVYGVYGKGGGKPSVEEAQGALGIAWMTDIVDLNEAIPPAMTEYLGRAFLDHLSAVAA